MLAIDRSILLEEEKQTVGSQVAQCKLRGRGWWFPSPLYITFTKPSAMHFSDSNVQIMDTEIRKVVIYCTKLSGLGLLEFAKVQNQFPALDSKIIWNLACVATEFVKVLRISLENSRFDYVAIKLAVNPDMEIPDGRVPTKLIVMKPAKMLPSISDDFRRPFSRSSSTIRGKGIFNSSDCIIRSHVCIRSRRRHR